MRRQARKSAQEAAHAGSRHSEDSRGEGGVRVQERLSGHSPRKPSEGGVWGTSQTGAAGGEGARRQGGAHLVREHQNRLQAKLAAAKVEEIFQAGTEEVQDHDVVVAFHAIPPHVWNPGAALEDLVQLALIQQLRVLALYALELYPDLFPRLDMRAEVNIPKAAAAYLSAEAKLAGYANVERHIGAGPVCAAPLLGSWGFGSSPELRAAVSAGGCGHLPGSETAKPRTVRPASPENFAVRIRAAQPLTTRVSEVAQEVVPPAFAARGCCQNKGIPPAGNSFGSRGAEGRRRLSQHADAAAMALSRGDGDVLRPAPVTKRTGVRAVR